MKKILSLSIVVAILGSSILVSPSASAWSNSSNIAVSVFGGKNREEPRALKIDANGNIYSTGYFRGTVDFDPGEGVTTLTSSLASIFLLKLDPSGNFLWVKSFGGSIGGNSGNTIAFDSAGNLYFGGNFAGTADFDPGAGTALVTAATGEDAFIVKLDSNGNYVWARSFGGVGGNANSDGIGHIEIDGSGNVYANGLFTGEVDFNSGAGTNNLLSISGTKSDYFVLKLDSSGNYLWAKSFGIGGPPYGGTLSLDNDGNVYAAGIFFGTVDFDPGAGTALIAAAKTMDTFIVKLDSLGNYRWANTYGGTDSSANEDWIFSLANDAAGNVYATGYFSGTVDFDRGIGVSNLTASGNSNDIFILKLNSSGEHLWSKKYGNSGSDGAWSIATDSNGNVYTTGGFTGEVNFNLGGTSAILTSSSNSQDTFIIKLDSLGNYLWAKSFSGAGSDTGISISLDRAGNIYTAGIFSNTVDFNPGAGISNFLSNGDADIFISKLDSSGSAPVVAAVSAGSTPNSKVAAIPSGVTEAAIAKTDELPAIKLNFGGAVPTAVTVAPVAVNPAPASVTPFVLSPSTKIVDIQLSGSFSGSATVCLDGSVSDRLYHFTNGAWVELGSPSYFNGQVCGVTTSFSPFTAAAPSPIPTAPSSVVATATGKRSATVNFTTSGSNGGSAITSYTATSTPGGITKTLVQATGGTFNFDGLQPSTSYTFDVTATNANGTSAAFTSNAIKTTTADIASLTSVTFTDDGSGTGGKLSWSGKNIDSVLYTGPASSYPGPFNFGAFSSSWNGSIRNLTPETEYTISIYAISVDGIGESKSLTFKTGANLVAPGGSSNSVGTQSTSTQLFQMIIRWVNENTYVKGEATNMTNLLSKFYALETSPYRSYIKVPVSRVSTVTATSLTPKSCSVVSATAKVDAGLVKALTKDICTISYTVSGPSKAPATLVKDFVFKKVS